MRTKKLRAFLVVAVICAPLIVQSTPPLPPEYYEFNVSGAIERPGGGGLEDHTVVLMAKPHPGYPDGDYHILRDTGVSGFGRPIPVSLTDAAGSFFLRIAVQDSVDSIAPAVVYPGQSPVMGPSMAVSDVQPYEDVGIWVRPRDGLCESDEILERVDGYVYTFPETTVTVP